MPASGVLPLKASST